MAWRRHRNGDEIPGFIHLEPLASGGNSIVYRAWQPEHDRWVAVKVLGLTLSGDEARQRFRQECRVVGRLTGHPNIVTVLASGVTRSARPFLVMDLFERGSLARVVETTGPLAVEDVLRMGVKLAGAIETAHRGRILHRDLKPENVLLSRYDEPGLADFGIATLGEAWGQTEAFTATHAAPEVLQGRPGTVSADVYGLGSTLWTALAGRLPFGDDDQGPLALMLRVLKNPLPPLARPDVPPAVEDAVRRAMEKEPERRPATALAFGQELRAVQIDLGLSPTELVLAAEPDGADSGRPADASETPDRRWSGRRPAPRIPEGTDPPPPADPAMASPTIPPPREAGPRVGAPGGLEAATMIRPRGVDPAPPPAAPAVPGRRLVSWLPVAILGGAALLAVLLILAALALTGRPSTRSSGPDPTTASPAIAAPTTAAAPITTAAPAPPSSLPLDSAKAPGSITITRLPTAGSVLVTWEPPRDVNGLVGYVVVAADREQAADGPSSTQATVTGLDPSRPQCVVVAAVYASDVRAHPSAKACATP